MDSVDIDKPIKNNSAFPMDGWSVDDNGLPFSSVQAALTHYDPAYRGLGKMVIVNDGTGQAIYWFARNLTELDLLIKTPEVVAPGALAITTHPTGGNISVGGNKVFSVAYSGGTAPYEIHWQKDGNAINGQNGLTLTIANAQLANAGSYRAAVSDSTGAFVLSNPAVLVVNAAPPSGTTYDTVLTYVANAQGDQTPQDDGGAGPTGVGGNAGAPDDHKKFEFNRRASQTGLPNTMVIRLHNAVSNDFDIDFVAVYPSVYNGDPFRYTDSTNTVRTGVYTNGNVDYN